MKIPYNPRMSNPAAMDLSRIEARVLSMYPSLLGGLGPNTGRSVSGARTLMTAGKPPALGGWLDPLYAHEGRMAYRNANKRGFYAYLYNHAHSTKELEEFMLGVWLAGGPL